MGSGASSWGAQSPAFTVHTRTLQERPLPAGGGASAPTHAAMQREDARWCCGTNKNAICDRITTRFFEPLF